MSSLNQSGVSTRKTKASYEGNVQDVKKSESQLFEILVSSFFSKEGFYETSDVRTDRLQIAIDDVVKKGNFDCIANIIVYARTHFHMRTFPIVATVLFANSLRKNGKSYQYLRTLVKDVIERVDEITDMYAFALKVFGGKKNVPLAIKKGVADAFNKFSEYQFAKYDRAKSVKLSDVLRIVHASPNTPEQGMVFEKIIKGTLETPKTWEVELSVNGQKDESERKSKKEIWENLIETNALGYMATLRNLRNFYEENVSKEHLTKVAKFISNKTAVANSKQLPFRFLSAYNVLENECSQYSNVNLMKKAIIEAVDHSLGNLPQLGNGVWVIIDCSSSMASSYSNTCKKNTGYTPIRMACLFASALYKANIDSDNVRVTMFSDYAKHIDTMPLGSILDMSKHLEKNVFGGGTNLKSAFNMKSKLGFEPDTVILLSDMQCNSFSNPNTYLNKNTLKVAINLEAYDNTPVSELNGWYQLAGFSDKIFDFIPAMKEKTSIIKLFSVPYGTVKY